MFLVVRKLESRLIGCKTTGYHLESMHLTLHVMLKSNVAQNNYAEVLALIIQLAHFMREKLLQITFELTLLLLLLFYYFRT